MSGKNETTFSVLRACLWTGWMLLYCWGWWALISKSSGCVLDLNWGGTSRRRNGRCHCINSVRGPTCADSNYQGSVVAGWCINDESVCHIPNFLPFPVPRFHAMYQSPVRRQCHRTILETLSTHISQTDIHPCRRAETAITFSTQHPKNLGRR